MTETEQLVSDLELHEQRAVKLLQLFVESYNSKDGIGLFSGISRYAMLETRAVRAAMSRHTVREFWARLVTDMQTPALPTKATATLLGLIAPQADDLETLEAIAKNAPYIVPLARALASESKAAYWKEVEEMRAETAAKDGELFGGAQ